MSEKAQDLQIVHYPDPRLRRVCEPVTSFDGDLKEFVDNMYVKMRDGGGVGLAAPQVGVNLRLFVMNITGEESDNMVFINPEIHDMHGSCEAEEGCLSLPDIYAQIRRATTCTIEARDINGDPIEVEGNDLLCRVWQHETDHLNGALIVDRMGPGDKIKAKKKLKELELAYKERRGG